MVGLVGLKNEVSRLRLEKLEKTQFLWFLYSYLFNKYLVEGMNWKKEKVITKINGKGAFVLYVQIQIGQIFTRSRA